MRLDANKLLSHFRRPIPQRVKDIGVWFKILDSIGKLAVITNVSFNRFLCIFKVVFGNFCGDWLGSQLLLFFSILLFFPVASFQSYLT
ncbi:Anoctamin-1 [Portunus trituberculatus]|uniref:Anoctamin n=1 Tax=Portunus trituberculatus TaxID=210409 RepID=A0A5B7I8M1_PORTR|nr:Anoctamin-1 [Portunus trituberculatus]